MSFDIYMSFACLCARYTSKFDHVKQDTIMDLVDDLPDPSVRLILVVEFAQGNT